ncbi:hypothetical protein QJQ45_028430 [Haematococcus lacustris]|nr:hypothetical protein QJQ45_028430 [Haematococcus lacustris]
MSCIAASVLRGRTKGSTTPLSPDTNTSAPRHRRQKRPGQQPPPRQPPAPGTRHQEEHGEALEDQQQEEEQQQEEQQQWSRAGGKQNRDWSERKRLEDQHWTALNNCMRRSYISNAPQMEECYSHKRMQVQSSFQSSLDVAWPSCCGVAGSCQQESLQPRDSLPAEYVSMDYRVPVSIPCWWCTDCEQHVMPDFTLAGCFPSSPQRPSLLFSLTLMKALTVFQSGRLSMTAQQLAIADAEACSKKRKRFHNLGKRYQDCHGTASFVSYSASGKQPAANRLTWNSLAIESLKDNEDVMTSLHVLMNGTLSNSSLRPRRRQRQCGSSSCDNDSDAAALDTHAGLSQDGACKKLSDARNLSMHKRAKGSLTAQGYAIGGSLADSISARLALASRHSPLGSALTEAGREAGLSGAGAGNPGSSPLTDLAAGRTPYLTALTADSPLPTALAVGRAPPNGAGAASPLLTALAAGRTAPGRRATKQKSDEHQPEQEHEEQQEELHEEQQQTQQHERQQRQESSVWGERKARLNEEWRKLIPIMRHSYIDASPALQQCHLDEGKLVQNHVQMKLDCAWEGHACCCLGPVPSSAMLEPYAKGPLPAEYSQDGVSMSVFANALDASHRPYSLYPVDSCQIVEQPEQPERQQRVELPLKPMRITAEVLMEAHCNWLRTTDRVALLANLLPDFQPTGGPFADCPCCAVSKLSSYSGVGQATTAIQPHLSSHLDCNGFKGWQLKTIQRKQLSLEVAHRVDAEAGLSKADMQRGLVLLKAEKIAACHFKIESLVADVMQLQAAKAREGPSCKETKRLAKAQARKRAQAKEELLCMAEWQALGTSQQPAALRLPEAVIGCMVAGTAPPWVQDSSTSGAVTLHHGKRFFQLYSDQDRIREQQGILKLELNRLKAWLRHNHEKCTASLPLLSEGQQFYVAQHMAWFAKELKRAARLQWE